ncbi:MAG TPA: response regulator [Candidatus Binatia bacterium]|nr:response regulator [Candidatus Binatia bacterium]HXK27022.1 response regulator [Candidatus Binatia bacterium]
MKRRILLVEDNPATREMLVLELKHLGYEPIAAKDGLEAVELALSELPDLIIMDMLMPQMNGFQAVSEIRKNPSTHDILILAATAKAMPGDRGNCLAAGCDDYLAKPFTHKELAIHIKELFEKNGLRAVGKETPSDR